VNRRFGCCCDESVLTILAGGQKCPMNRALFRPVFLAAWWLLLLPASRGTAAVLLRWDFEGDKPFHDVKIEGEPPVCVPDPLNPANQVMRSVLRTDSTRSERSEVRWDSIHLGEERWVGFKILVMEPSGETRRYSSNAAPTPSRARTPSRSSGASISALATN